MSVVIDSDNNNVNITEEPINVTISTGGADVSAVWGNITGDLIDQTDLQTALDGKVPYNGATGDVNLGEYGIQLGNLEFDNTPTNVPTAAGSVYWSDTDGTLNMVLKGGQTISRIGETQHIRALNNTGVQIARGKVVYVVGAQGQRLTIALADADTEILSKDTIGFTSEAIADGAEGFVLVQGVINNVNTNGMADGATVYLSQTAGGYTTTPPVDPAHLVILGFIVNGNSGGAGSIYVKVDNGYELGELHDVNTTGATNGQVLTYNGTTWVPATNGSGTVTSIATSAPITGGTITTSGTIGITQAGAAADGYLSATDWNTFNNKQAALSLTTTGTSGAATLVGSTLNIPQYQAVLTNPVTGTGTAGQVAYWSGTGTQTGSNNLFWDAANNRLGIGTASPTEKLHVASGNATINGNIYFGNASHYLATDNSTYAMLSSNRNLQLARSGTPALTIDSSLNVVIGTTSASARLHVRGSGTTSATTALLVQNSDATPARLMSVRDDGRVYIGSQSDTQAPFLAGYTGTTPHGASQRALGLVWNGGAGTRPNPAMLFTASSDINWTSGTGDVFQTLLNFNPTSGSGVLNSFIIQSTINQTGGANGITRGLYVSPILTAAADWRSVEFSNNTGWGIYGAGTANNYLGGSLGMGTTTPSARLHVRGSGTTSATTALLVQNGTPTELMSVRDDGKLILGITTSAHVEIGTLSNFYNVSAGYTHQFRAGGSNCMAIQANGRLDFIEGGNIQFGTTTGTKIGTSTTQKIGLWNATPIVQPTTAVAAATIVGGGGTTVTDTDTFDGYTIAQIVKALRNIGALA